MVAIKNTHQMTAEELETATQVLREIVSLPLDQCNLDLCLASTQGKVDKPSYRRVNVNASATQVFRASIKDLLLPMQKHLATGDMFVKEFSVDPVESHVIEYIDLNRTEYDVISKQLTELITNYQGLVHFEQKESVIVKGLRFYTTLVQEPGQTPVYFYRKYTETQVLRESTFFGISLQDHNYKYIEEPTLLFDRHIDCLHYKNHLFVFKKENFYNIFRYMDALNEAAEKTLASLKTMDIIQNFPRFHQDCMAHPSKVRILKNIAVGAYLENLTIDDLERHIAKYKRPIQFRIVDGKKKMLYHNKQPYEILNVLNDNFFDSELTNHSYQASSKQGIRK
ncbi:hypothetical protein KDW_22050 [Dictyobacter vulcani]|uniref:DUF4868 domain-containing protein n=1 Tax=Dictyobacter vulcani TaxID=2607529 RepID=A0A5J4KJW9_9CHLR|nr:Kiwa anti-phage protein KwaB-like domain-containing protein [Dictyobacter vulcani]GER88043.1 hypothetical protein KDW_22050 [Dictyobacter vulcani]